MTMPPNHALQRTRPSRPGCKRGTLVGRVAELGSLGRSRELGCGPHRDLNDGENISCPSSVFVIRQMFESSSGRTSFSQDGAPVTI